MGSDSALAVVVESGANLAALGPAIESAKAYAAHARSDNTVRAYEFRLRDFAQWCGERGARSLPASGETVAAYLASRADSGVASATLAQALAAISQAHADAGLPSPRLDPAVRLTWKGIRNSRAGHTRQRQAAALSIATLRDLVRTPTENLAALRDRALILVGFAAALRRSELVGLDVSDLVECADGLVLTVRKSKTDQTGVGREIPVVFGSDRLTCAVRAWRAWLEASGLQEGAAFRGVRCGRLTAKRLGGGEVTRILRRRADAAGVASASFSGHSLRAGLATAAARAGKSAASIAAVTGHKSVAMLQRYVRRGTLFEDVASAGVGL
jgi:site-specific recombinase XerD